MQLSAINRDTRSKSSVHVFPKGCAIVVNSWATPPYHVCQVADAWQTLRHDIFESHGGEHKGEAQTEPVFAF